MKSKGATQFDYILAAGIFILMLVAIVQFATSYFADIKQASDIVMLRNRAVSLLSAKDGGFYPNNWSEENIYRIGFGTDAYRFYILVNNTGAPLSNELVKFNYSSLGFYNIDYNSTAVYGNGGEIPYQRDSDTITFNTTIGSGEAKWFAVYFDDDSNFPDRSTAVTGTDSLTEKIYPAERISVIQYEKLTDFSSANYTKVKQRIGYDFSIELYDTEENYTFFSYSSPIEEGNVVALSSSVLYQNSTGGIREGMFIVRTW